MNKREVTLSISLGIIAANAVFATDPKTDKKPFDINSITLFEEEAEIELGFNTFEYLPEGFDPFAYPQHVDGFNYVDEKDTLELDFDTSKYLPEGFDAFKKVE
jgi:hypothetical protein